MPAIHEANNLGDLLKFEAPNLYSRDVASVAVGQKLALGAVVSLDAEGRLKALTPAAEGGDTAVGVLAVSIDATSAERHDALFIARHAVVASDALIWPSDITPEQKAAAIAQLKARGLLVRASA
ncbi:head decoration protein [Hahella aquimaris]|uniref:head decoration protein n=1 Tax=Hahella sp. HNIBRBA332 TaxID=3015983 RepID=UPI00273AB675|nr:head decoration protein [Hahella sp. HNIBRBA332]WLQ14291.1 head decoration protein [Hahella sp. HNIBRBA332]